MSGEYKQISVNVPVLKNYSVSRLKFRDQSIYKENADWLAHWFYTNMDAYTNMRKNKKFMKSLRIQEFRVGGSPYLLPWLQQKSGTPL